MLVDLGFGILRGGQNEILQHLGFGGIEVDLVKKQLRRESAPVHLTPTEYDLLETMVTNPGKLLTHAWLLQKVWGGGYGAESHYLRVYVRQLRIKLGDDATAPRFIVTEPGVGYRLRDRV